MGGSKGKEDDEGECSDTKVNECLEREGRFMNEDSERKVVEGEE